MAGTFIVEFSTTTACNLRCKYCYSAHINKSMPKEIADLFFTSIPKLLEKYNKDNYHVSFFGGDPLMNWDIIEYMVPKLKQDKLCDSIVIITNGLLLNQEKIDYLKEHHIPISLSFDGLWNKDSRPLANNKSSFDLYIKNKELLRQITTGCKVMLSPQNFSTLTENFEFFIEDYGFMFPDFSLVRDDIYTEHDLQVYDKEITRLADRVIKYNKEGIVCNAGIFTLYMLDAIVAKKFGKRDHGCFAGHSGALYSTDGKYYPCERFSSLKQHLLYDAVKDEFYDSIDILKQPKYTDNREFPECKACVLYQFCNAGCTWSQLEYGKKEDRAKPVDSVCRLLKMSYREAFRVYKELVPYGIDNILEQTLKNSN